MTTVAIGDNIAPAEMPQLSNPETPPVAMPAVDTPGAGLDIDAIKAELRAELRGEMDAAVADAERRLAQAREIEAAVFSGVPRQSVHTEDLNIGKALVDGYTMTANSPSAGYIAWSSLHVVLLGVDYTITDGNTNKKFAWFVKPGSGTTATLQTSDTMPVLGANDALIFVNNGGQPISVLESSITYAVAAGVIGSAQLDTTTQNLLNTLQANDISQQAALDGAITSYYQNEPPWPAGSPSPSGGDTNMGDIWYDSNDGGAFRWTGASGTPANSWERIADTDTSSIAALVNTKVTTYIGSSAPAAPAGGFTTGDLWIDTSAGNVTKRWSGSAWATLTIGDAAIATGISGSKIGSGINAANVSTGTMSGARVGTGISPANLTGSGTAPIGAIPTLTPAKLNTAFHMLY